MNRYYSTIGTQLIFYYRFRARCISLALFQSRNQKSCASFRARTHSQTLAEYFDLFRLFLSPTLPNCFLFKTVVWKRIEKHIFLYRIRATLSELCGLSFDLFRFGCARALLLARALIPICLVFPRSFLVTIFVSFCFIFVNSLRSQSHGLLCVCQTTTTMPRGSGPHRTVFFSFLLRWKMRFFEMNRKIVYSKIAFRLRIWEAPRRKK